MFYSTRRIFILLEKLLFYWKRNVLDTGKKNYSTGQKNYSTGSLICRHYKILIKIKYAQYYYT